MKRRRMMILVGVFGLLFCSITRINIHNNTKTPTARTPEKQYTAPQKAKIGATTAKTNRGEKATPTLAPTSTPTPTPKTEDFLIWMGWTECESGEDSWNSIASDGGHAYGRYQLDDRYDLAEFFRFCVNEDVDKFESFTTFYEVVEGKAHLKNRERIPEEWNWLYITEKDAFCEMQTRFAFEYYYENAKKTLRRVVSKLVDIARCFRGLS